MEWSDLIKARENTFAWDYEREVDPQLIKDAMWDTYMQAPTKNLKYPFVAKVIKNDEPERRKEIMAICHRNADLPIETDGGNPQVLAPYLIGFCQRDVRDLEVIHQKTYTRKPEAVVRYDHLEIGIQATYLMLGLKNRGLDTGLSQNCCNNMERTAELFGLDEPVRFLLGVGYSKGPGRHKYLDPRTNTYKPIPYDRKNIEDEYPRPAFDKIYQFEFPI